MPRFSVAIPRCGCASLADSRTDSGTGCSSQSSSLRQPGIDRARTGPRRSSASWARWLAYPALRWNWRFVAGCADASHATSCRRGGTAFSDPSFWKPLSKAIAEPSWMRRARSGRCRDVRDTASRRSSKHCGMPSRRKAVHRVRPERRLRAISSSMHGLPTKIGTTRTGGAEAGLSTRHDVETLVDLARRAIAMSGAASTREVLVRLRALSTSDVENVVAAVPELSDPTATFIVTLLEVNRRRLCCDR